LPGGPAALDGQDVMNLGGQSCIGDVGGLADLKAGVEGAAGGQGGDDPGLADVALASDLVQELGGVGIDRGGGGEEYRSSRSFTSPPH
jgi:hypothetical protein